jgi:hypothetical protein
MLSAGIIRAQARSTPILFRQSNFLEDGVGRADQVGQDLLDEIAAGIG